MRLGADPYTPCGLRHLLSNSISLYEQSINLLHFINKFGVKYFTQGSDMTKLSLVLVAMFFTLKATAQDLPKEMYMPNEAGGFIVLTTEPCAYPAADKLGYKFRAYATEDSELARHEGCWDSPDTSKAPKTPDIKIISLVNLWFDGDMATFPQYLFGPEKKRWDLKPPEIEVKPTV
jgi:hypothetical protein